MCMHVLNGCKWRCPAVCCDVGTLCMFCTNKDYYYYYYYYY
jgi:hypothetical protein